MALNRSRKVRAVSCWGAVVGVDAALGTAGVGTAGDVVALLAGLAGDDACDGVVAALDAGAGRRDMEDAGRL